MHFVTLTVPPPCIDHSLMHNITRGRFPGQKGSQVRFREKVRFKPFAWVIAHGFQHSDQFFCNILDVHILLVEDIWPGFRRILDCTVYISGLFQPV
jgi:hypothetical protein